MILTYIIIIEFLCNLTAVNEQVLDKKCDSSSPSKLDSMSAEKIEMESDADSPLAIATSDASTILPFT